MANWSTLKTAVADIINTNGNQAITGQLLQNVLNNIITNVGENATFAGIATLTTNPGTPDGPVFYLATTAGIYANFNGIEVQDGEAVIFLWNNNAWSKKVTGFATQEKLSELGSQVIYDVSANNDGATFASLSALLSSENLSTLIPIAVRCGGMSIRFAQTSDNKYIQYFYHGTSTAVADFTNVANWEKMNLEEEVRQLDQKVGNYDGRRNLPFSVYAYNSYVNYDDGTIQNSSISSVIRDVDVSAYAGKTLLYSRFYNPNAVGLQGMAFYDAAKKYISGIQPILNAPELTMILDSVVIPLNAKYASFSCVTTMTSIFEVYGLSDIATDLLPLISIDNVPTKDSDNLVKSGGVYSSIKQQATLVLLPIQHPYVTNGKFIDYTTGVNCESAVNSAVNDVDISGNDGKMLYYSRVKIPSINLDMLQGMAFFGKNGYISGVQGTLNASEWGISLDSVIIPEGATTACFTCPTAELPNFQVYIEQPSILGKLNSAKETLTINQILYKSEEWQKLYIDPNGITSVSTNTLCTNYKHIIEKNTYLCVKADNGYKYRILFLANIGTGPIVNNTAYSLVQGDYDDATVWHTDDRLLSIPNGAACFTINIRKIDDSAIEVSDCEHLYVYNTYGAEYISTFYNFLKDGNKNVLLNDNKYLTPKVITYNGVTYTSNGENWSVTGQATETSWAVIAGNTYDIPQGIDVGKLIMAKYSGTNVALHIVQYDSNRTVIQSQFIYNDSPVPINAQTTGIEIRLRVAKGAVVNEEVNPVIIGRLDNDNLSKELYNVQQDVLASTITLNDKIVQCAKSYYAMTRANRYTYGKRSALYYPAADPEYNPEVDKELNQVHCGGLTYLMASGCPFYSSRYTHPESVNESYAAGYGFDFEAYSLRLAKSGVQEEIDYIGAENVNKTVSELKELMLFKTSYKLSVSCLRWNMIKYVQSGSTVDVSKMQVGDMIFYGNPNSGEEQYIDGKLIIPTLIEGNLITHCDTVIYIKDGTPYVIDAGAAPVSIHPFNNAPLFSYVCIGRVPLFDIIE